MNIHPLALLLVLFLAAVAIDSLIMTSPSFTGHHGITDPNNPFVGGTHGPEQGNTGSGGGTLTHGTTGAQQSQGIQNGEHLASGPSASWYTGGNTGMAHMNLGAAATSAMPTGTTHLSQFIPNGPAATTYIPPYYRHASFPGPQQTTFIPDDYVHASSGPARTTYYEPGQVHQTIPPGETEYVDPGDSNLHIKEGQYESAIAPQGLHCHGERCPPEHLTFFLPPTTDHIFQQRHTYTGTQYSKYTIGRDDSKYHYTKTEMLHMAVGDDASKPILVATESDMVAQCTHPGDPAQIVDCTSLANQLAQTPGSVY